MSDRVDDIGREWLIDRVHNMDDKVEKLDPVTYNEQTRYLPQGVSPRPGFIRYDLFPYLREILAAFDPHSPVREVNLKKGVQTGYTTLLESVLFYYIGHIKTTPGLYITADKELASARVENNIMPMLVESDMKDRIRSADVTNTRKTGQTKDFLQWDGGGFLIFNGAQNAAKMRQFSMPLLLKDELDGWPRLIGKDGNADGLTDDRASAYWEVRKILRGSTPTEAPSMIDEAFRRGDQRVYNILCKHCSAPQPLRMDWKGTPGGFDWDLEDGRLILESVRYKCKECAGEHYETDKEKIFSAEAGAHWEPTATPVEAGIRSYHLPAFYSPYGFRPWSKSIADYIEAWDVEAKQVTDPGKYQVFYNNVLGEPFAVMGGRVSFSAVSGHRRGAYMYGQVPNTYAAEWAKSKIVFLTCQADLHKENLAVTVMGWTEGMRCFVIDYWRFEDEDCTRTESPVWGRMQELLEETTYTADDGQKYGIAITFIDASYATDTVVSFCASYAAGVYPIMGRDRPAKYQTIKEFADFKTQQGTTGYRILVDHYKDRIASALRREWLEDSGVQRENHFNAPLNATDAQLKELTAETRKKKEETNGTVSYYWHRPSGRANELFDLLVYGHCAVEVLAWEICIKHFELDTIDWNDFWQFAQMPENDGIFARIS